MSRDAFGPNLLPLLLCLALAAPGCGDDDPTQPTPAPPAEWSELKGPEGQDRGTLRSVAARNGRELALYLSDEGRSYIWEERDGSWSSRRVDLRQQLQLLDLAIDSASRGAVVGYILESGGPIPVLLEEQGDWTRIPLDLLEGGLQSIGMTPDDEIRVSGLGVGTVPAYEGRIGGRWDRIEIPVGGSRGREFKSVVDLVYRDGVWLACGANDGWSGPPAAPFQFLMREENDEWSLMDTPCGTCLGHAFRALEVDDDGRILLAGRRVVDTDGPGEETEAFLWRYDPVAASWEDIELPKARLLQAVEDLILAQDGALYLVCGDDQPLVDAVGAYLLRMDGTDRVEIEWAERGAFLRRIAETTDGLIAVGQRRVETELAPLMLGRPVLAP